MDDIAREAGFTKPILYQSFDSKTDLYREIVAQLAQTLLASLKIAVNTPRRAGENRSGLSGLLRNGRERNRRLSNSLHPFAPKATTAKELRALELGLISFMFPFFDPSMSEEHDFNWLAASWASPRVRPSSGWNNKSRRAAAAAACAAERLAERSATLAWGGLRTAPQD